LNGQSKTRFRIMSNIREDRLGMMGEPKPPLKKEVRGYRDKPSTSVDAREFDEVMTLSLPLVGSPLLATSAELRAIPVLFPPSKGDLGRAWITDQPTWMLPAVPDPAKAGKQASVPATPSSTTG